MLEFRTILGERCAAVYSTLVEDISDSVPAAKQRSVPRVGKFLRPFCRRYSLDEIPQLPPWRGARADVVRGLRPIKGDELNLDSVPCKLRQNG